MGGRPKKPTSLKVLQGTFRKDRGNPTEPRPDLSSLRPPMHLDIDAKKQWRSIARELHKMGVLTTADRAALARYCQLQVVYNMTHKQVEYSPKMVNVLLKIAIELRSLEVQFGLTPSSRTRIHAVPPTTTGEDEKAKRKRLLFG